MKKNKLNEGHYVEALDRLFLFTDMMDTYLMNHPVIRKNKEVKKLVRFSIINLLEAYQQVGDEIYKIENEKNNKKVISRRHKNPKH